MHFKYLNVIRYPLLTIIVLTTYSCVSVSLAPGADRVKITKNVSDVSACKAVGNVNGLIKINEGMFYSEAQLRNRVVGLDGNTVFLTTSEEGVAYRCP